MAEAKKTSDPNRALDEFSKRKSSLEEKHKAEIKAIKIRQKREMEALEARYSYMNVAEKKNSSIH